MVAPSSDYHMEDVHRAGGIPAIMGELDRAGLLDRTVHAVHAPGLTEWLDNWDISSGQALPDAVSLFASAPGGVRTTKACSTTATWDRPDLDDVAGCIRSTATPYSTEGGLAVLRGNLAPTVGS
jgi:dihydroxy-acid dehydratase